MRCCVTLMQRSALHLLLLELAWPGPIGALAQSDRHARQAWQSQQCELLLFLLSCTEIACALPRPIWRIVYSGCRRAPVSIACVQTAFLRVAILRVHCCSTAALRQCLRDPIAEARCNSAAAHIDMHSWRALDRPVRIRIFPLLLRRARHGSPAPVVRCRLGHVASRLAAFACTGRATLLARHLALGRLRRVGARPHAAAAQPVRLLGARAASSLAASGGGRARCGLPIAGAGDRDMSGRAGASRVSDVPDLSGAISGDRAVGTRRGVDIGVRACRGVASTDRRASAELRRIGRLSTRARHRRIQLVAASHSAARSPGLGLRVGAFRAGPAMGPRTRVNPVAAVDGLARGRRQAQDRATRHSARDCADLARRGALSTTLTAI